jgi:death-on-curing protein
MDEPTWVSRVVVDAVHYAQIQEHGGSYRTRDEATVEMALARPRNRFLCESEVDLADLAAAYLFALATLHAYVDGNKRTAVAVSLIFLDLNGHDIDRSDTEVEDMVIAVATRAMSEEDLAHWVREALVPLPPPEADMPSAVDA